jgi:hypothetical protein
VTRYDDDDDGDNNNNNDYDDDDDNNNTKRSGTVSFLHLYNQVIMNVRFQVPTAASMEFRAFWDVAPCSHVEVDRRFIGAYCLHHHRPDNGGITHL